MTDHFHRSAGSLELKPCPFCNRSLEHDPAINATFHPKIPYEEYCPLKGFLFASDRSDIIASWNTRAVAQPTRYLVRNDQGSTGFEIIDIDKGKWVATFSTKDAADRCASALAAQPPAAPVKQDSIEAIISGIGAADTPAEQALEIVHKLGRAGYAIVKYGDAAPVEPDEDDDASYERGFKAGYEVAVTSHPRPSAAPVETTEDLVLSSIETCRECGVRDPCGEDCPNYVEPKAHSRSSAGNATERAKAIVEEAWRRTCAGPGEFDDYAVPLVAAELQRPASAPLTAKDVLAAVEWKNTTVNAGLVSAILQKFDVRLK